MESIYEIIKAHSDGKGEGMMWKSTKMISDAIEAEMPKEAADKLKRDIYALMCGGHFNEDFAKEAVSKMYYEDENGERKYAPYWTESAVREVYESVKDSIAYYNFWDFFATLHMVASDTHALIVRWFPDENSEEREARYVEMAVNWLNDADWPTHTKIWDYLNMEK